MTRDPYGSGKEEKKEVCAQIEPKLLNQWLPSIHPTLPDFIDHNWLPNITLTSIRLKLPCVSRQPLNRLPPHIPHPTKRPFYRISMRYSLYLLRSPSIRIPATTYVTGPHPPNSRIRRHPQRRSLPPRILQESHYSLIHPSTTPPKNPWPIRMI